MVHEGHEGIFSAHTDEELEKGMFESFVDIVGKGASSLVGGIAESVALELFPEVAVPIETVARIGGVTSEVKGIVDPLLDSVKKTFRWFDPSTFDPWVPPPEPTQPTTPNAPTEPTPVKKHEFPNWPPTVRFTDSNQWKSIQQKINEATNTDGTTTNPDSNEASNTAEKYDGATEQGGRLPVESAYGTDRVQTAIDNVVNRTGIMSTVYEEAPEMYQELFRLANQVQNVGDIVSKPDMTTFLRKFTGLNADLVPHVNGTIRALLGNTEDTIHTAERMHKKRRFHYEGKRGGMEYGRHTKRAVRSGAFDHISSSEVFDGLTKVMDDAVYGKKRYHHGMKKQYHSAHPYGDNHVGTLKKSILNLPKDALGKALPPDLMGIGATVAGASLTNALKGASPFGSNQIGADNPLVSLFGNNHLLNL